MQTARRKNNISKQSLLKRFAKSLKEGRFRYFGLKNNIIPIVSAIIAFLAVWFSYKQVSVSREAMNITNKAYISISKIEQAFPTTSSMSEFHTVLQFENSGQTPAYDVQVRLEIEIVTNEIDLTSINKIESSKKAQVLGKNNTITFYPELNEIRKSDANKILSRDSIIFIHGKVVYKDIFHEERFLNFRMFYDIAKEDFVFSQNGNSAN